MPLSVPALASFGDLPVPLGLERPADGADLRLGSLQAADDGADPVPALDLRPGIQPAGRRRVPVDVPAPGRVLLTCSATSCRASSRAQSRPERLPRSAHALGPGVVPPVPDLPDRARRRRRRGARPARGGRRTCASRSTGSSRRSTTTSRSGRRPRSGFARSSASGRLAIGPWQTLMDEFLVDGETTLRNLEAGLRALGGLRRARCASATSRTCSGTSRRCRRSCARPASRRRSSGAAFRRRSTSTASSGKGSTASTVVAEYLPDGYGNAAYLFDLPGPVDLRAFEERFSPWFGDDPVLGIVGTDHMPLAPDFAARVPEGAEVGTLARLPRGRDGRGPGALARRAALRCARQPPPRRRLGADRPEGCVRARGALARALRGAAAGALRRGVA